MKMKHAAAGLAFLAAAAFASPVFATSVEPTPGTNTVSDVTPGTDTDSNTDAEKDPFTRTSNRGWKTIDGKRYYFNKYGTTIKGRKTIKGKSYYFDPEDNGAMTKGWKKLGRRWYFFNKKGRLQKNGIITDRYTGTKYLAGPKGVRKTGLRKIKGFTYYFDPTQGTAVDGTFIGGAMATGFKTIKDKTYYFAANGRRVTGWLTLDSKQYYFDTNGEMQTGKLTVGSKIYTFASNGVLKSTEDLSGPYSIKVNQGTNVVTIYKGDTPIKAMLCSVGLNGATPSGTFYLSNKKHWQPLFGTNGYVYGQYTSTITGNILFHSVYYLRYKDDNSLATGEFRKLGQAASHGCVRLSCGDSYYIYHNIPNGTKVTIFWGNSSNDPLGKPANQYAGWTGSYDPTDPIKGD